MKYYTRAFKEGTAPRYTYVSYENDYVLIQTCDYGMIAACDIAAIQNSIIFGQIGNMCTVPMPVNRTRRTEEDAARVLERMRDS